MHVLRCKSAAGSASEVIFLLWNNRNWTAGRSDLSILLLVIWLLKNVEDMDLTGKGLLSKARFRSH